MRITENGLILDDKNDWISGAYPEWAERLAAVKGKTLSFEDLDALASQTNILRGYFSWTNRREPVLLNYAETGLKISHRIPE